MMSLAHRRGSVILLAIGTVTVLTTLIFAFVVTAKSNATQVSHQAAGQYAGMAALEGTAHALGVLRQEFLATPGVPTNMSQRWYGEFRPHQRPGDRAPGTNMATATTNVSITTQVYPGSAADMAEDDVKRECWLWGSYYYHGGAWGRMPIAFIADSFTNGRGPHAVQKFGAFMSDGAARYFEPGYRPSSHQYPIKFSVTPTGSAVPTGTAPIYLDGKWRRIFTDSADITRDTWEEVRPEARYRLRYAVAMEDLGGHLIPSVPGEYQVPSGSGDYGKNWMFDELSDAHTKGTDAENWTSFNAHAYSLEAMFGQMPVNGSNDSAVLMQTIRFLFDGRGSSFARLGGPGHSPAVSAYGIERITGSVFVGIPTTPGRSVSLRAAGMRPSYSPWELRFAQGWNPTDDGNEGDPAVGVFLSTPFGRAMESATITRSGAALQVGGAPARWYQGMTDVPWHVNILTAPPGIVGMMAVGYLPKEAFYVSTTVKTDNVSGYNLSKNEFQYTTVSNAVIPSYRTTPVPLTTFYGGPYPGIDPTSPPSGWTKSVGKYVLTNRFGSTADAAMVNAGLAVDVSTSSVIYNDPADPVTGASFIPRWDESIILSDTSTYDQATSAASGTRVTQSAPSRACRHLSIAGGYHEDQSYYLDLAASMLHTVAVVRNAWLRPYPLPGYEYSGANAAWAAPSASDIRFAKMPASMPASWALTGYPAAGQPMIDTDVDGDGVLETPSALDTIQEVDALFCANLGEYPGSYATGTRPTVAHPALLASVKRGPANSNGFGTVNRASLTVGSVTFPARTVQIAGTLVSYDPGTAGANLKMIRQGLAPVTIPGDFADVAAAAAAAVHMERVLNDYRMSFFGASGQYPEFRPKDFDDDGTVWCSGYGGAFNQPADILTGDGPAIAAGNIKSVTGCFSFMKSRFWRIISRGEVWDEALGTIVDKIDQETFYAIDPDGSVTDLGNLAIGTNVTNKTGMEDSHVLYQHWLFNNFKLYQHRTD